MPLRAFLLVVFGLVLVACAGIGQRLPSGPELREQILRQEQSGYTYGYGLGETPEKARQAAYYQIAGEVVTAIRGEQREVYRLLQRRGELAEGDIELAEELKFESTVASLSHVFIEGAEVVSEQRSADGWVVAVRVPERRMADMRVRAREQAPALAQLELTQATPDSRPGLRFQRALSGLETVKRLGLETQRTYIPERGETTFLAYFSEMARDAVESIQAVPVVEDGRVRFAVIDRESMRPQPRLNLTIDGYSLVTNSSGWTDGRRLEDLSFEAKVIVEGRNRSHRRLLSEAQRRADILYPRRWSSQGQAVLYLHSEPAGAVMQVGGREVVAPARVELDTGREYLLRVKGAVDYRYRQERINIDAGSPAAYYSAKLTERRFGELDLTTRSDKAVIRLEDRGIAGKTIERRAEAGTYRVRVSRDSPRYQDIVDEIVLREGERVRREYVEPPDRFPHYFGWRWGVNLGLYGGEPGDEYLLPAADEEGLAWADFGSESADIASISRGEANLQLGATAHYFTRTMPLVFTAEVAYRREQYAIESATFGPGGSDREDGSASALAAGGSGGTVQGGGVEAKTETVDLFNWQGSLGVGLWRSIGMGVGWLTLNQAWQSGSWGDSGAEAGIDMPAGRVEHSYLFVELGGSYQIWGFGVRVADLNTGPGAMLWVGVGGSQMDGAYQRPAEVQARPGVHY